MNEFSFNIPPSLPFSLFPLPPSPSPPHSLNSFSLTLLTPSLPSLSPPPPHLFSLSPPHLHFLISLSSYLLLPLLPSPPLPFFTHPIPVNFQGADFSLQSFNLLHNNNNNNISNFNYTKTEKGSCTFILVLQVLLISPMGSKVITTGQQSLFIQ